MRRIDALGDILASAFRFIFFDLRLAEHGAKSAIFLFFCVVLVQFCILPVVHSLIVSSGTHLRTDEWGRAAGFFLP